MQLPWIKKAYLYLVSLVSIIIMVIGAIMLINIALKAYIFTKADDLMYADCPSVIMTPEGKPVEQQRECDKNYANDKRNAQRQSDAAQALAMILVASPVFYYHWKLARQE